MFPIRDRDSQKVVAQKSGGMGQFAVALSTPADFEAEVATALRAALEAAGEEAAWICIAPAA